MQNILALSNYTLFVEFSRLSDIHAVCNLQTFRHPRKSVLSNHLFVVYVIAMEVIYDCTSKRLTNSKAKDPTAKARDKLTQTHIQFNGQVNLS